MLLTRARLSAELTAANWRLSLVHCVQLLRRERLAALVVENLSQLILRDEARVGFVEPENRVYKKENVRAHFILHLESANNCRLGIGASKIIKYFRSNGSRVRYL